MTYIRQEPYDGHCEAIMNTIILKKVNKLSQPVPFLRDTAQREA